MKYIHYIIITAFTAVSIFICYMILNINTFVTKSVPDEIKNTLQTYNQKMFNGETESLSNFAYAKDADFLNTFNKGNKDLSDFFVSQNAKIEEPKITGVSIKKDFTKDIETNMVGLQARFINPISIEGKSYTFYNESFTFLKTENGYKIIDFELTPTNEEVNTELLSKYFLFTWLIIFAFCLVTSLFYVINNQNIRTYWLFIIFLVPFGVIAFWIFRPYRNTVIMTNQIQP